MKFFKDFYIAHKKSISQLTVFTVVLLLIYIFFKFFFTLFAPFVVAFILSRVLYKPVNFISHKSYIHRGIATAMSMVVILSILGGVIYFVIQLLTQQISEFVVNFPSAYDKAVNLFLSFQKSYYHLFDIFPEDVKIFFEKTIITLVPSITALIGGVFKTSSFSLVKVLPKMLFFTVIMIISTFFMTKDKQIISEFLRRQIPAGVGNTMFILKKDIFTAIFGYIKAQLILMCFSGCIAITGLMILRYHYAFLLGLAICSIDALPILGSGFIIWPWIVLKLLAGEYSFALGLSIIYLAIVLIRQIVEPKILSSQIGLYPLVTLGSLYIGLKLLGPIGVIIGPLFVIIVKSLQKADLLPDWN